MKLICSLLAFASVAALELPRVQKKRSTEDGEWDITRHNLLYIAITGKPVSD